MGRTLIIFITVFAVYYNSRANKIDSLKTNKDVAEFVDSFSSGRYYISMWDLISNLETHDAKRLMQHGVDLRPIYDSLNLEEKRWIKTDLDNNGETDLLVFTSYSIFAFTSDHDNFSEAMNNYTEKYAFTFPKVRKINGQNLILIYFLPLGFNTSDMHVKCDTLVFRDKHFFSYLSTPRHLNIEQIEFHDNGACEGNCLKIDINIDAKLLTGNYEAKHLYPHLGHFDHYSGQVSKEKINAMLRFFDYSNFPDLNETYGIGMSDQTTATWKITYDNGKTKIISDYGERGSATLNTMFNYLAQDLIDKYK